MTTKPSILECTLRDGSYSIGYRFTAADTVAIVSALDRAGFEFIEVGHGVGIGAADKGMGAAAETDEAYMKAAASAARKAKWGMIGLPGIMELHHVDMAADHGMSFLRVGTNITELHKARPFIERARRHGMMVMSNLMKSYVATPEEFRSRVQQALEYGADVVYLVDSAGGMLPEEIGRQLDAARTLGDVTLGFHGHNNLGMAVSNTLHALAHGATLLDTALQGLGRSAGNACTEQVLCVLSRMGHDLGIDLYEAMDVGERHVRPWIDWSAGLASVEYITGHAQFHSSFFGTIQEVARLHGVDPRRLIAAVCKRDKVNAPRDLVEVEARNLSAARAARYELSSASAE